MKRLAATLVSVVLFVALLASCSAASGATVVDGVQITTDEFDLLHIDVGALDDDERAGSQLLLILREAFRREAGVGLGIEIDDGAVEAAYQTRIDGFESRGGIDTVLERANHTADRVRIEAELDVIRDAVGETLVRTEAPGFDIAKAYEAYLLAEAEVCVRLIQLEAGSDFDAVAARLVGGEDFADVAREVSIDPFVGREDGSGAGGELGCSAPSALPVGLNTATLSAPLGEATGPVATDNGLYLIVVYDRTAPDLADVRDEVVDLGVEQQGRELFRQWAVEVLQTVDVEVADQYGVWGVLPETDPVPGVVARYRANDIIEAGS